jgi:hypothetical protein
MKDKWERYPFLSDKCLDYQQFSLITIPKKMQTYKDGRFQIILIA